MRRALSFISSFALAACGTRSVDVDAGTSDASVVTQDAGRDAGDGTPDSGAGFDAGTDAGWSWPREATRLVAFDRGDFFHASVCDFWIVELDAGTWDVWDCGRALPDGGVNRVDGGSLSATDLTRVAARLDALTESRPVCVADARALRLSFESPNTVTAVRDELDFCSATNGDVAVRGLPELFVVLRTLGADAGP